MGEVTGIAWCHHTFNPWWGCVEVSPACDRCYAKLQAARYGHAVWGADAPRRFFGDAHWNEPFRWNRKAEQDGVRRRVFCASMADIGEERKDDVGARMDVERMRLWNLIKATPHLDWLLLTKRPRLYRIIPPEILALPRVWPGVTVESPEHLWRLNALLDVEAAGPRWVSYEPALAAIDFAPSLARGLAWVVVGGESGSRKDSRPFEAAWACAVVAQCRAAGAAPFVKQMGRWVLGDSTGFRVDHWLLDDGRGFVPPIIGALAHRRPVNAIGFSLYDSKGGDPDQWPEDLRVREFPR